jgi:hypothetical protein
MTPGMLGNPTPDCGSDDTSGPPSLVDDDIDAGLPNGQRYSDHGEATTRAAWNVVKEHCPDRTEKQCRTITQAWIENGVLVVEEYDDPVQRRPGKGPRVDPGVMHQWKKSLMQMQNPCIINEWASVSFTDAESTSVKLSLRRD